MRRRFNGVLEGVAISLTKITKRIETFEIISRR
jgi:hypothetical protein